MRIPFVPDFLIKHSTAASGCLRSPSCAYVRAWVRAPGSARIQTLPSHSLRSLGGWILCVRCGWKKFPATFRPFSPCLARHATTRSAVSPDCPCLRPKWPGRGRRHGCSRLFYWTLSLFYFAACGGWEEKTKTIIFFSVILEGRPINTRFPLVWWVRTRIWVGWTGLPLEPFRRWT